LLGLSNDSNHVSAFLDLFSSIQLVSDLDPQASSVHALGPWASACNTCQSKPQPSAETVLRTACNNGVVRFSLISSNASI
jgi:hypothetical protein